MSSLRFSSRALLLFLAAAGLAGARPKLDLERVTPVPGTEPVPIMDFFRPRMLHSPTLNRAGTHMAALVTVGQDRDDLLIFNLADKSFKTLRGVGTKNIYSVTWLTDRRLVYMLSEDKHYALGMMAVDIDQVQSSYALLEYDGARLISIPERNRRRPLVWRRFDALENGRDLGVAEIDSDVHTPMVNLAHATADYNDVLLQRDNNNKHIVRTFANAPGMAAGYLADRVGELAYAVTGEKGVLSLFRLDGEKWTKCPVDLDEIALMSCGDNPGEILVRGPRRDGKPRPLQQLNAGTGELGNVLLQDKAYDFNGWLFRDPRTLNVVGAMYERSGPTSVWFDEGYRALQKTLDAAFPKQVARIIDIDTSGRVLVAAYSDRQPVVYYLADLPKQTIGIIKSSAPWIDPARMQPMNIFAFQTRDGRKLEAYVTLPPGTSKKHPVPLVVLPHGGPWVRDSWGFDAEAQFLASRGYAVLQPNYRGSTGYDWMFPEEDRYEFRKMHDDVTDATKALLAAGFVDRSRVAIMGGSFGAYLALSGVAHEPDLYRCAVTIAGVFDWETVMAADRYAEYLSNNYAILKRKLGDPAKQQAKFAAISPLRFVNQIKVPLFVAHGKDDHVAEVGESKRLIAELKKHGIRYEALLVGGEGHGMAELTNQVELYSRIEAFLARELAGPAPSAAPAAPSAPAAP
jgi:dienelactone hydrolase